MKSTVLVLCTLLSHDARAAPHVQDVVLFDEAANDEIIKNLQNESIADPDPKVGIDVDLWRPGSGANPEELGTYTQGDMLIPHSDTERNGIFGSHYRWPGGIVYYQIENDDFTATQRQLIMSAIDEYHKLTCIQFKPYTGKEPDYVHIQSEKSGCWSAVGRIGGKQTLNLQSPGCLYYIGTTIHELMHVLGFYHEQSRTDRDDFIEILWPNIKDRATGNFREQESNAFGVPYDYGSVMHYSAYAFSKNHERTIVTKQTGKRIGQRLEFSRLDIQKVGAMYNCPGVKVADFPTVVASQSPKQNATVLKPANETTSTTAKPVIKPISIFSVFKKG